jgi:phosphoglycolate phosphatase-like HAD superfamily hydrolase
VIILKIQQYNKLGLYFCVHMNQSVTRAILALDFDGVLCDGMQEYFHSSWAVYRQLWSESGTGQDQMPHGLFDRFTTLRPAIEHGWEMPLLVWALMQNHDIQPAAWSQFVPELLVTSGYQPPQIAAAMDAVRDRAIQTDLAGWLDLQRCYPGTVDRLNALPDNIYPVIITTKDGRFTRQLLESQGIHLPADAIYGKEMRQSKADTLRQLLPTATKIWFVEDRLPTLSSIASQPDLASVELFLADWGYNTVAERAAGSAEARVTVISLDTFNQLDPTTWKKI